MRWITSPPNQPASSGLSPITQQPGLPQAFVQMLTGKSTEELETHLLEEKRRRDEMEARYQAEKAAREDFERKYSITFQNHVAERDRLDRQVLESPNSGMFDRLVARANLAQRALTDLIPGMDAQAFGDHITSPGDFPVRVEGLSLLTRTGQAAVGGLELAARTPDLALDGLGRSVRAVETGAYAAVQSLRGVSASEWSENPSILGQMMVDLADKIDSESSHSEARKLVEGGVDFMTVMRHQPLELLGDYLIDGFLMGGAPAAVSGKMLAEGSKQAAALTAAGATAREVSRVKIAALGKAFATMGGANVALSFGNDFDESRAQGADILTALRNATIKTSAMAGVDLLTLGTAQRRFVQGAFADMMLKSGGSAAAAAVAYAAPRSALGEKIDQGTLLITLGTQALVDAPVLAKEAGLTFFAGTDTARKPLIKQMFEGQAELEPQLRTFQYASMLEAMANIEKYAQTDLLKLSQDAQLWAEQAMTADVAVQRNQSSSLDPPNPLWEIQSLRNPSLSPPTHAQLTQPNAVAPTTLKNIRDGIAQVSRFVSVTSDSAYKGGDTKTTKLKGGHTYLLSNLDDSIATMTAALAASPGNTKLQQTLKHAQDVAAVAKDFHRELVDTLAPVFRKLYPDGAVILTEDVTGPSGAARRSRPDTKGNRLVSISFNPLELFELRTQPDGTKRAEFSKNSVIGVIAHEFGHGFAGRYFREASSDMQKYLRGLFYEETAGVDQISPTVFLTDALGYVPSLAQELTGYSMPEQTRQAIYRTKFNEWLADKLARATLYDLDPASVGLPELAPLLSDYRTQMQAWYDASNPTPSKEGFRNFLEFGIQNRVRKAYELAQLDPDSAPKVLRPREKAGIWDALQWFSSPVLGSVRLSEIRKAVDNVAFPEVERLAMAETLRDEGLLGLTEVNDKGETVFRDVDVDMQRMAATMDGNLRFYRAVEAFSQTASWGQKLRSVIRGETTKLPSVESRLSLKVGDSRGLSAMAKKVPGLYASVMSLLQYGRELDHPILNRYIEAAKEATAARGQVLDRAQILARRIRKVPASGQQSIARSLAEEALTGTALSRDEALQRFRLTEEEADLREQIKAGYYSQIHELGRVELKIIHEKQMEGLLTPEQADKARKSALERVKRFAKKPYGLPMMRFGDHMLSARAKKALTFEGQNFAEGQTVLVEAFETAAERDAAFNALKAQGLDLAINAFEKPEMASKLSVANAEIFDELKRKLADDAAGLVASGQLSEAEAAVLAQQVNDVRALFAPESSYAKRLMRRQMTQGFSVDLERIWLTSQFQFANFLANAEYQPRMDAARRDMSNVTRIMEREGLARIEDKADFDRIRVVQKMMDKHAKYLRENAPEWAGLREFTFFSQLAWNVKSAVSQYFALGTNVWPQMANLFGDSQATGALGQAIKDTFSTWTDPKSQAANDVAPVLGLLQEVGFLQQNLAHELVSLTSDSFVTKALTKVGLSSKQAHVGWSAFKDVGSRLFAVTEQQTRWASAIAMARLLPADMSPERKARVIQDRLTESLGDFRRYNRPAFMRGKLGSNFNMFFSFVQNSLYFMSRRGNTARYMLLGALSVGAMGLPGMEDIADLADTVGAAVNGLRRAFGGEYANFDSRLWLRDLIESVGMDGESTMYGASRHGFGIPAAFRAAGFDVADVDLYGTLGTGRVIPNEIMRLISMGAQGDTDFSRMLEQSVQSASGATGAMFLKMARGIFSPEPGIDNLGNFLPTALDNALTGYQWLSRGYELDKRGQQIASYETPQEQSEALAKMLSFQPTRRSTTNQLKSHQYNAEQYWTGVRESLTARARRVWESGLAKPNPDQAEIDDVLAEIDNFNQQVPIPKMQISADGLRASVLAQLRQQALIQSGQLTQYPLAPDVAEAYNIDPAKQTQTSGVRWKKTPPER